MSDLDYLAHYGTKGMEWHKRRYQNYDGSLTPLGRVHYGVGEDRKKISNSVDSAGKIIKNAPKNAKKAIKKTASDLKSDRKASKEAARQRRRQAKIERAEYKELRRREKAEDLARKLAAKESKKTLKELKAEFDEARMNDARNKVLRLIEKQERVKEKAFLKEQEKLLKKSMKKMEKDAKREAHDRLSRKDIQNMTDQELQARITRLSKEAELVKAEAARNINPTVKFIGDQLLNAGTEAAKSVLKEGITAVGKNWFGLDAPIERDTAAVRAQKLKDVLGELKAQKELDDFISSQSGSRKSQEASDEALAREARRYQNMQTIANAKRSVEGTKSEEDNTKKQARELAARKEDERRASAYYKNGDGLTISEIAERMGVSESKIKDLLYLR